MTIARPVYSLKDFLRLMQDIKEQRMEPYPYYSVFLYAPTNGLDGRLHQYMTTHWDFMDTLTGPDWLLLAVEAPDAQPAIADFKPEDIYLIARQMGQPPDVIPGLIFFSDPLQKNETLSLKLNEFFSRSSPPQDEELTDFFRSLAAIIYRCRDNPAGNRLRCLRQGIEHQWPADSHWSNRVGEAAGWLGESAVTASNVVAALTPALVGLRRIFGT